MHRIAGIDNRNDLLFLGRVPCGFECDVDGFAATRAESRILHIRRGGTSSKSLGKSGSRERREMMVAYVESGSARLEDLHQLWMTMSQIVNPTVQVPFHNHQSMEDALRARDVAAVIMETIPATYGFPMPQEGYLPTVKKLCERYDAPGE